VNYERKVDSMDSLAGTQSFYEETDNRRKRTRLIVGVVLIVLALAAARSPRPGSPFRAPRATARRRRAPTAAPARRIFPM
jgi:hypothetical protein